MQNNYVRQIQARNEKILNNMKFITYVHLIRWADTKDCQIMLPELIKKLIRVSVHTINRLTIPSGDAVNLSGWDAIVETPERINTIDEGLSLWEMGATRNVTGKIDSDFNKRDLETGGLDKTIATFVFITPRTWVDAAKWVEEKKNNSEWKNIIVYTAVELEDWIEQHPTIGLWLANRLGLVSPSKIELIDEFWNRWARGKDVTLRYDLLLGGRTKAIDTIQATIVNPSVIYVEALSREEAKAFIVATFMLMGEESPEILDRSLVVYDVETLLQMAEEYKNLIFIIAAVDIPHSVITKGHSVICAVSPADEVVTAIKLPIVERNAFISSLEASGFESIKARQIALDTARNVMALRRSQEIDVTIPEWANPQILRLLIPAFLAGRWNENVEGDKKLLEELSNTAYAKVGQRLKACLLMNESPLIEIDGSWRVISPYEVVGYTIPLLTTEDKNLLNGAFKKAMSDDDPDAVDKIKCVEFRFWQHQQKISGELKEGLCQTLILLTIHDEKMKSFVDNMVEEVLKEFTLQRYLSNRRIFMLLAEASPNSVLNFIENDLKNGSTLLNELFIIRKNSIRIGGTNIYYAELLFALEEMAWDENYLLRCVMILLKLCEYPNDSNWGNNPINSLCHILSFILPQTYATDDQREAVLRTAVKKVPKSGCTLILKLFQDLSGGVLRYTAHYRWRMYNRRHDSKYFTPIHPDRVVNVCRIMLNAIEPNIDNINKLINLSFHNNMECIRTMILEYVNEHKYLLKGNDTICNMLRTELDHQISCEDREWLLSSVKPYQDLLDDLIPDNVFEKNKWLFVESYVCIPYNQDDSEKEYYEILTEYRRNAIREIFVHGGFDAIVTFAKKVECSQELGSCYAQEMEDKYVDDIIRNFIDNLFSEDFIIGYFGILYYKEGCEWFINKVMEVRVVDKFIALLRAPMYHKDIAEYVETLPQDIQKAYWKTVKFWRYLSDDVLYLIDKMQAVNRIDVALEMIHRKHNLQISDKLKLECLTQLLTTDADQFNRAEIHYIVDIIKELDNSEDTEVIEKIPQLELLFYPILEHRVDVSDLKLMHAILHQPLLLMELIEMAYLPEDEEKCNVLIQEFEKNKNKEFLAKMALKILFDLRGIPCADENGDVNVNALNDYIEELLDLAKEKKQQMITYSIIGRLLGNIPEKDNYPPEYLSDIMECLDNDQVDSSYSVRLFNKRGVITRTYNAGGAIEWAYVKRYKLYGDRTRFSHPRITRVFDSLVTQYENMAYQEDAKAKLIDLDN